MSAAVRHSVPWNSVGVPECRWVSPNLVVGVRESRGGCPRISRESRECPARANAPLVGVPECLRMSANLWVSQNLAVHPVQWVSPVHRCPRFSECPRFAPRFSECPRFIVRAGSRGSVGVPELRPNCIPASRVRNPFEKQADFRQCQHSARTRHEFSDPMRGQQHEHAIPGAFREGHDEHKAPKRFAQNSGRQGQRVADEGQPTEQERPVAISLITALSIF